MSTLRQLRTERGLSQEAFASPLSIDRTTLSRMESGKRSIPLGLVREIIAQHELTDDEIVLLARGYGVVRDQAA